MVSRSSDDDALDLLVPDARSQIASRKLCRAHDARVPQIAAPAFVSMR